ncbi:hypothetical protein BZA03_1192 [Alteromonas sp. I10]|nr:hypothetical protein BZA03_1192 [Alteromonas sp. I10]
MLPGSIGFKGTNKPINALTPFAGTHTRELLRILTHASAPLI